MGVTPARRLAGPTSAAVSAVVLVVVTVVSTGEAAGRDHAAFAERALPVWVALAVLLAASVVPLAALVADRPRIAIGLVVASLATLAPLAAAWPDPAVPVRGLALTAAPLSSVGYALVSGSRAAAAAAGLAFLAYVSAYDPFADPGCSRLCLDGTPTVLDLPTDAVAAMVAALLAVAAVATGWAATHPPTLVGGAAAAASTVTAVLAVVRWQTGDDPARQGLLLVVGPAVPAIVAVPVLVGWVLATDRRRAANRLADQLADAPASLLGSQGIDEAALSPGRLLALRTTRLREETTKRMDDLRASQRRVVEAGDAERRRIERDLHDGAQQRLVGVLLQLPGTELDHLVPSVRGVLEHLRALSLDARLVALEEEGLVAALEELRATSDARIDLALDVVRPVPPEQARTVYHLVLAAASAAESVTVDLRTADEGLVLRLDPATDDVVVEARDRFGALGGRLSCDGSRVEGFLPCVW